MYGVTMVRLGKWQNELSHNKRYTKYGLNIFSCKPLDGGLGVSLVYLLSEMHGFMQCKMFQKNMRTEVIKKTYLSSHQPLCHKFLWCTWKRFSNVLHMPNVKSDTKLKCVEYKYISFIKVEIVIFNAWRNQIGGKLSYNTNKISFRCATQNICLGYSEKISRYFK